MPDKSKLGFNINPKKYDELNSTDNLITSGSDSGWLGKKLQGDGSNDLNLSKINPLFDKELYEKYRPGVNTNDGSVNQDIWGYKCFNSPVSFRNGIYGDTYSITEQKSSGETIDLVPETHATIKSDTTVKNKIYNRTENNANSYSEYTYKNYHGLIDYDNSWFSHMGTVIPYTVIPDSDEHTISDIIIKSHSESHCDNNAFAINDEYERTLCSVRPDYYIASAPGVSDARHLYSVNHANTQYERKLRAYTPAVYTDNYFVTCEKNVTATFSMHANSPYILNYGDEPETGANILLEANCAETVDGIISNKYASFNIASPDYDTSSVTLLAKEDSNACNIEVTTNYINIGAADGYLGITNDKFSRMLVSNNRINKSISGNALDIDYHVKDIEFTYMNNTINVSGPAIDITFDYRRTVDNDKQYASMQAFFAMAAYPAGVPNLNGVASINVHGLFELPGANNTQTRKDYCGTYITPMSVTTNSLQFDLFNWSTFCSDAHNKLVPIKYEFKFNDNDHVIVTDGLQLMSCKSDGKTTFICDYLVVNESIKCKSLGYIDPETNSTTDVLTVQSNNLILPNGNKEISIGNNDHMLNSVYAENFYGTAKQADKATNDYYGNDICGTYVKKINNYSNDIQSYNAIIGSGERLFFFNEPCIENSIESPEDIPKPYISICASYEDNGVTSKNVFSWTNKDKSVTRKCAISSKYDYDAAESIAFFRVYPEKAHVSDIADIGMAGAPWSNIWCKRLLCDEVHGSQFPAIVGSTDGTSDGTSVGNIRLLCIKAPTVSQTLTRTIEPGEAFESPVTLSDNTSVNPYSIECTIHIANFKVTNNSNNSIGIDPGKPVKGKWVALSGTYINASSANISPCFPVLAMRVE